MFGTIRKHKSWLWGIIIAGTVVSFVIFFSPNVGFDSRGPSLGGDYVSPTSGKPVTLFGQPISRKEFDEAYKETLVFYFIRSGKWPDTDERAKRRIEADALYRLLLVKRAADLGIHVSKRAVAKVTLQRIGRTPYSQFVERVLRPAGLSSADFERFARHEAIIQQLAAVITTPAKLINPKEAEMLYRQDNEAAATQAAVFWATNFMDRVTVTPLLLGNYFTNSQARYRIPPRVVVNYVEFMATNYLAAADQQLSQRTNLNELIEQEYFQQGTNSFTDTNGVVLSEEAAKAKLKQDIREEFGLVEARKKASAFGTLLYDMEDPNQATNFYKLAAEQKLDVKETPPFSYSGGLEELDLPSDFQTAALKLQTNRPIHFRPIVGDKSVYVICLKTNLPSEQPVFAEVKDKVTLDFKRDRALRLALSTGTNFYKFLTNGLAAKKSFADLCAEKNITPLTIPPFSASTQSLTNLDERMNLRQIQQYALDLEPGEVSPFIRTMEGGMILYLQKRIPVTDEKVQAELPEFIATMRNARFSDAFNSWLRQQVELAQLSMPRPPEVKNTPSPGRPVPVQPASPN